MTRFRQIVLEPKPRRRFGWLRDWWTGIPEKNIPPRAKLRRVAVVLLTIAAGICFYTTRSSRVDLPKPVVVSISHSNNPLRVYAGGGAFLFILPDGALWRWGHPNSREPAVISQPQQVGTNHDWTQASVMQTNTVGLRADGTLWTWEFSHGKPRQVGSDHDWVRACASYDSTFTLKRDGTLWAWGDNSRNQLGNGPGPRVSNPAQVGTISDWKDVRAFPYPIALRADGTLWTWGRTFGYFSSGGWFQIICTNLTQVCAESNWVGFSDALGRVARNDEGVAWSLSPFSARPGEDVPVATIGRRISTNAVTSAASCLFATNWTMAIYDTRSNGTLWVSPDLWPPIRPSLGSFRFDDRSDWVSVWGDYWTAIGLTSDGTVWTWGLDYGQKRQDDVGTIGTRIGEIKKMMTDKIGANRQSQGMEYDESRGYRLQKEPRPLFRLDATNSPPARVR